MSCFPSKKHVLSGLLPAKKQKSNLNCSPFQTRPSSKVQPGWPFFSGINCNFWKETSFPFFSAETQTLILKVEKIRSYKTNTIKTQTDMIQIKYFRIDDWISNLSSSPLTLKRKLPFKVLSTQLNSDFLQSKSAKISIGGRDWR